MTMDEVAAFDAQVERIRKSGCLGRSQRLQGLFDYLVEATRADRPVREVDIAENVFGRDSYLGGDASVRVYVHRLRKKLEDFHAQNPDSGPRLLMPLGKYRLELEGATAVTAHAQPSPPPRRPARWIYAAAAVGLVLAAGIIVYLALPDSGSLRQVVKSPVWSMIDGDRPVKVVVGDYYIFGELGEGGVSRMVRDFDVNSPEDLQAKLMNEPTLQGQYIDLDTTYTATGSTEALQFILPVVFRAAGDKANLQIIASSNLTPEMLRSDDIVYVGYLSALRLLEEPLFANSRLKVGVNYDELRDPGTGRVFSSNAGMAKRGATNIDYGYLRAFQGPSGNHIIVVAGTRDIGVLQMAESATKPPFDAATSTGVEALYEVRGIGRTNINARRISLTSK